MNSLGLNIEYLPLEKGSSEEERWCTLQQNMYQFILGKIQSTNGSGHYTESLGHDLDLINSVGVEDLISGKRFPYGRLSEVFFLNACGQIGLPCGVSTGEQDLNGIDFIFRNKKKDLGFDVTLNIGRVNVVNKILKDNIPVLFLPSKTYCTTTSCDVTYFENYLYTGLFNGREYLERVLINNQNILKDLSRRKPPKGNRGYIVDVYSSKCTLKHLPDGLYIKNSKEVLSVLEEALA